MLKKHYTNFGNHYITICTDLKSLKGVLKVETDTGWITKDECVPFIKNALNSQRIVLTTFKLNTLTTIVYLPSSASKHLGIRMYHCAELAIGINDKVDTFLNIQPSETLYTELRAYRLAELFGWLANAYIKTTGIKYPLKVAPFTAGGVSTSYGVSTVLTNDPAYPIEHHKHVINSPDITRYTNWINKQAGPSLAPDSPTRGLFINLKEIFNMPNIIYLKTTGARNTRDVIATYSTLFHEAIHNIDALITHFEEDNPKHQRSTQTKQLYLGFIRHLFRAFTKQITNPTS